MNSIMREHSALRTILLVFVLAWPACTNNPYRPGESAEPTYFSSFSTPPTKLDPTSAYYVHEGMLIDQIYEPPFTYHYLLRPYKLIPLTAEEVPAPVYYDAEGARLPDKDPPSPRVARAEYTIRIKPGIFYQNHPCFATTPQGQPYYRDVHPDEIRDYEYPSDFPRHGTREVLARDYALQIRRLADPRLASPVFSTLAEYILGLDQLHESYKTTLEAERAQRKASAGAAYNQEQDEKNNPIRLDYMAPEFPGVQVLDDHTYQITLKRKYPQILYWMCMHFFSPVPQEALDFYDLPAMIEKQFSLNRCPVGSGPYYMKTFRPHELIVLEANPNYHDDRYPVEGEPGDEEAGLLRDAGKRIPFITRQVWNFEKEDIPTWNKFLQGYVDASGIYNDVFDQAVRFGAGDGATLSEAMKKKGIRLITDTDPTLWYTAFNLQDETVGGYTPEKCKLRQAIAIALDYTEYLDIFLNGRGLSAQGPIPPGIFGYEAGEAGVNPYVNQWDSKRKRYAQKPIEFARQLLAEAGYPDGMAPDGKPLTLYYDHSAGGDTFFRSRFEWTWRRLSMIGIQLQERATDLSRFRQKKQQGNWQMASGGWLADYPDPENFLFLFYGPNSIVKNGGPNMCNYENTEYDRLFLEMESMADSPERLELIRRMVRILQHDAPAAWQFFPVSYILCHDWYGNVKPHKMSYNTMKYRRIAAERRAARQAEWNQPVLWPLALILLLAGAAIIPAAIAFYRQERGK